MCARVKSAASAHVGTSRRDSRESRAFIRDSKEKKTKTVRVRPARHTVSNLKTKGAKERLYAAACFKLAIFIVLPACPPARLPACQRRLQPPTINSNVKAESTIGIASGRSRSRASSRHDRYAFADCYLGKYLVPRECFFVH